MLSKITQAYCCEHISNIENYEKAINSEEEYICHHRLEVQDDGTKLNRKELMEMDLYYSRPANELIYLTRAEHNKIHRTGAKGVAYWKGKHLSEETKQKLRKPKSEETKRKLSLIAKERFSNKENHPMYGKSPSEETRRKSSLSHKGQVAWNKGKGVHGRTKGKWYNNGSKNIRLLEMDKVPAGFIPGRIFRKLF